MNQVILFEYIMTECLFIIFIITLIPFFSQESATSLPKWILTTFVMTLGELNYADNFMPWEYPFAILINTLFVLFVLAMPIILMNMLVRIVFLYLCIILSTAK